MAMLLCLQTDTVVEKLRGATVPYEFVNATLDDVVEMIRETAQVNVVVSPRVKDKLPKNTWFNLNLKGVRISSALAMMLEPLELAAVEKDGVLEITTKESVRPKLVVRLHDVRDLQRAPKNFVGGLWCGT